MARIRSVTLVAALLVASVGVGAADLPGDTRDAQQGAACDYAALYNQTVNAVVSVRIDAGQGSGFVYRAPGNVSAAANASYVVTNAHVVGDASEVTVQFTRGEYRTGTVVGTDTFGDLAVVRVPDTPGYVRALPVADDDPVRGERVAALGNPLGLEETITQGIVSGVNRTMPTDLGFTIPNVVQTDAAISPGNSGGPLVACDGTVVGVNTAGIVARGAENIGFAVAASLVEQVVPALVENGTYAYSYLGVRTAEVTPPVARANDLNVTGGAIVVATVPGGPAEGALQGSERVVNVSGQAVPVGGDVIVGIEGTSVESTEDLATYLVTETRPGDDVTVTVIRDGERRQVNVTLGERPDPGAA
jgi:S1-C subfamily serine protease